MQKWLIDFVDILPSEKDPLDKLSEKAYEGWEPYAISGITHYFKRLATLPEESKMPKFETPPIPPASPADRNTGNAKNKTKQHKK